MASNGTSPDTTCLWRAPEPVDWVDYAKGICIVHGRDDAFGARRSKLAAARPVSCMAVIVRQTIPDADFFLISGLFCSW